MDSYDELLQSLRRHKGSGAYSAVVDLLHAAIERRKEELVGCSVDRFQKVQGAVSELRRLVRALED